MELIVLYALAVAVSSIGFRKFIWFISIGYGFSIAAIGIGLLFMFSGFLTPVTAVMSTMLIVYGCRLGGFLLYRERTSETYNFAMRKEIKDGSDMQMWLKVLIWLSCALLYFCEASPLIFRLSNGAGDDLCGYVGMILMILGIVLESVADYTKNQFKKLYPRRFCDAGVFRIVRYPNYLGEIITWTGVFVSGLSICSNPWQWIAAIAGWVCIVYIMFGGARRLELRQNKNYGNHFEYQKYVRRVPILIPLIPLYSVADVKWLKG